MVPVKDWTVQDITEYCEELYKIHGLNQCAYCEILDFCYSTRDETPYLWDLQEWSD